MSNQKQSVLPDMTGMTPSARIKFLKDNAYNIKEGKYFKKFTDEELAAKKDDYVTAASQLADKQDEFKEISAKYKGEIKEMALATGSQLSAIRQRGEYTEGETYMFDDQAEGFMYTFDENGEELERRRLKKEEKQTSVLTAAKNA